MSELTPFPIRARNSDSTARFAPESQCFLDHLVAGFKPMGSCLKTGSALVRLALPENSGLRPGQFVGAHIVTEELTDRLVVPRDSVVKADDAEVIYVVEGDKAVQIPVKTGLRDANLVEVAADGLKEGDTIVTVGACVLPKETKVKITNR
jgi:hypothetical protein